MRETTIWYCKNKEGVFVHNHIEDGHILNEKPTPMFDTQKDWVKQEWKKEFVWLDENNIIVRNPLTAQPLPENGERKC